MTRPDSPMLPMLDRRPSRRLITLTPALMGGVILVAEATDGELASGLIWFAVLAATSALLAFGGRFQAVRDARGEPEDERDALIGTYAMAAAGTVMILVLTAAIVFELARGHDPSPYTYVIAAGGAGYAIALLTLRRYS